MVVSESNFYLMEKAEKAAGYFDRKFNCAQAVLAVFGEESGLSVDHCMKVACSFGGGMGKQQLTCGAVTGALMALGLIKGMGVEDDVSAKEQTYDLTVKFCDEFKARHGSLDCRTLLRGLDMNDTEGKRMISELQLHTTLCPQFVKDAVRIAEKILDSASDQT